MAHSTARSDVFSDSYYWGREPPSQNEASPYPYFFEREHEYGPLHHNMPVVSVFCLLQPSRVLTMKHFEGVPAGPYCQSCAPPWSEAPDLHGRVQGEFARDGVSCNVWSDAQHNAPFVAPAMARSLISNFRRPLPSLTTSDFPYILRVRLVHTRTRIQMRVV
jgi:hypothetical protein